MHSAWMPLITFFVYISGNVVGILVSRRGTGRRRLYGAAHVFRKGRKKLAAGDAVVQHRALCGTAVALDLWCPGFIPDSVSQSRRTRKAGYIG